MKRVSIFILIFALLLTALPTAAQMEDMDMQPEAALVIHAAWTAPDGMSAYVILENPSDVELHLVGVAENATLMLGEDAVDMVMLPAGAILVFSPDSYFIALDGTSEEATELTLTFEPVSEEMEMEMAATAEPHDDMHMDMSNTFDVTVAAPVLEDFPTEPSPFKFSGYWARSAIGGINATGAAYVAIENTGDVDDVLVSASAPIAEFTEIHEMSMEGDVMMMSPLEGGLPIPAGETAILEQGGTHIMMINIADDLDPGAMLPLTLTFESGQVMTLVVPVRDMLGEMNMDH